MHVAKDFPSTMPCLAKRVVLWQRHDGIRDPLTSVISKICKNVESEPHLQPLDNSRFNLRTANISPEARLDIKAGGFWPRGVTAFFYVRVTNVNSASNKSTSTTLESTGGGTRGFYASCVWNKWWNGN